MAATWLVCEGLEVTPAMREAGAMMLLEVRSCMCETEEDAAEAIFMAMLERGVMEEKSR